MMMCFFAGNVCCGLVGGPGIVAGSNIGEECRVFETVSCRVNVCGFPQAVD